jgi:plastocyanin
MAMLRAGWARMMIAGAGAVLLLQVGVWTDARAQSSTEVPIQAFVFQPTTVTVPVGTTITWTNHDPVAHTVTDVNQAWDSGLFEENGTYSMTFDTPGTYTYYCIPHPIMTGTIEVTG